VSPTQFRLIRITGLGVCITLLALRWIELYQAHNVTHGLLHGGWLFSTLVFAIALSVNTAAANWTLPIRMIWMSLQSLAVIAMGIVHMNAYLGFLLLVVAWQIAILLPFKLALSWIAIQTVLLAAGHVIAGYTFWAWMVALVCIVFKCFTYIVVFTLKRESDAREAQIVINSEMLATRELFAERSRSNERLRISRDLHDVLGHRLTALSLNLEIALNKCDRQPIRADLERAQNLTANLLRDVREVVSAMRLPETVDLRETLRSLARGFPPLTVHLNLPEELKSCDPDRAQVLIRCAQELITNAVKHARASQLWIELTLDDDYVLNIESRDDGTARMERPSIGTGLLSMGERFEQFGGQISVGCTANNGFLLHGSLPMRPVRLDSVAI
jgi:signal transduction histidine kinase